MRLVNGENEKERDTEEEAAAKIDLAMWVCDCAMHVIAAGLLGSARPTTAGALMFLGHLSDETRIGWVRAFEQAVKSIPPENK